MQKDNAADLGVNRDVALIHDGIFVYWILEAKCWQWGTAEVASVRRGQGCRLPDIAGSRRFPGPYSRAQLGHAALLVAPLWKRI